MTVSGGPKEILGVDNALVHGYRTGSWLPHWIMATAHWIWLPHTGYGYRTSIKANRTSIKANRTSIRAPRISPELQESVPSSKNQSRAARFNEEQCGNAVLRGIEPSPVVHI